MLEIIKQPWPWYIAGPLIGLVVPLLLIAGNKMFGISSTLRQICAACFPADISFFKYDWKANSWNLFFAAGIIAGAFIAVSFLNGGEAAAISRETRETLESQGIKDFSGLLPLDIFSLDQLFSVRGMVFMVIGGFLVGFGTRYAGGCTSGHSITGIATLQWPSLAATCCFMAGGFLVSWLLLPYLIKL